MLSVVMKTVNKIIFGLLVISFVSCEKEITVDLPQSNQQYVVEASINQALFSLSYVFITKSVDYFNPDLSIGGIEGASVFITEGTINGTDTVYDGTRTQLFDISQIPGADTLLNGVAGIYFNPLLAGTENRAYLLEITLADGTQITGKTYIPKVVPLDSVKYEVRNEDSNRDDYNDAYVTLYFVDPPEQNNYRIALYNNTNAFLIGWGAANSYRTFDDELLNGQKRIYPYARPFQQGDTLNFYFNSIGRKEYLFWQSFGAASNNAGPFATPVQLKSNITGAIGSFTGYGCSFKQVILN
jgi:hypothetical protein